MRTTSLSEAASEFWELLEDVVASYLPDVGPPGIALSGGLDSTALAAATRGVAPTGTVHAIRAVYSDFPDLDESRQASAVVRALGLEDHQVEASELWPLAEERVPSSPDSPHMTPYPEWLHVLVAAAAAQEVGCLFLGMGGDNLFGGQVSAHPELLAEGRWARLADELEEEAASRELGVGFLFWHLALRPWLSRMGRPWKRARWRPLPWLTPSLHDGVDAERAVPRTLPALAPSRERRYRSLTNQVEIENLGYVTAMARKMGVDVRLPLWDRRLQEFAWKLPTDVFYRHPLDKRVLRQALAGRLPRTVLIAPKTSLVELARVGFAEAVVDKLVYLTHDMRAADLGFVEPAPLRRHLEEFRRGAHRDFSFWNAICLELWLRAHF